MPQPTSTLLNISERRLVGVHAEHVSNVSSRDFPGHYPGEDHSWDLERWKQDMAIEAKRVSQRSVELDVIGVDASIANAIRRTLIADVPTICIENVYVWNNTSVIHDEVLAHRLGLVPLNVNPNIFELRERPDRATDRNTVVFKLNVECKRKRDAPANCTDPDLLYENHNVTAGMLQWIPQGEQSELKYFQECPPAPTNPNIVLAKLRPGQAIDMELHAVKGFGREHAKWSAVATASYRLHPFVQILKQPSSESARKFIDCFSPGVIDIIDEGKPTARVEVNTSNLRGESMSREVFRHNEFEGCVKLGRIRDWFLFNIESEGPYAPIDLFPAAISVLRGRLDTLRKATNELANGGEEDSSATERKKAANEEDIEMVDS